ncbi:MAG: hypothetical protein UR28_C0029G0008 [Candidatus Peregrinibacteria bacterium GW2011_GWF2_33_10]|nr:MAG: hypothetical protein UR28_C0029G0008 [Candidatus Peregrinibacteria bacterium GW2011_GWF2_33_10]OGJ45439.1 MAG: hypothetical protein A2263_04195 [Candidatus Peregrinibacteria bacterium RIFOXYA2_FULL_33_21]OGJ46279.1 MAG: hypothetical protein A2272_03010 [Candidatus Peregrinibacteria bacterium RIFOXYA12_FULL_33_12]OGJ51043.1 MAG: hypothetical protein A2307_05795 [Candidatus Peregrinibacteria bacterium RIFOXYB2_FULL_33_20]
MQVINSLQGKTILLVNTGSIKKKFIVERLKELGLKIIALHKEKNWAESLVDHFIIADNNNHAEAITAVERFMVRHPDLKIEGALTFWEQDVVLTSKIVDKFGFIGIPLTISSQVRNKYLFREFCRNNNLPAPKHKLIKNKEDLDYIARNFTFPCVIKPTCGAASLFVIKIENTYELVKFYNYLKDNLCKREEAVIRESDILVEEYIDGDEVDIDILVQNGEIRYYSITDNFKTREPYFVETGQIIPSLLPGNNQDELISMAKSTLEKLRVKNGCIHFEAKSTKNGAVPIEVNLRMGGDEVWSFVKGAWGCDLVENAAKIALGIDMGRIERGAKPNMYLMGQYFLPDFSGHLATFNVNEDIYGKKYLYDFQLFKQEGDAIFAPPEGYDYLGWVTVKANNAAEAQLNMQNAFSHFHYRIDKFTKENTSPQLWRAFENLRQLRSVVYANA